MNRRIEMANDVTRNGIPKTSFSYSHLLSTMSLVMFLTPINGLHSNGSEKKKTYRKLVQRDLNLL